MADIIQFLSAGFAALLWAVFGLYLWIPAVVVAMLSFVAAVMGTALTEPGEGGKWMKAAESTLENTISMYANGFTRIWNVVSHDWMRTREENRREHSLMTELVGAVGYAGGALFGASIVWWVVYLLVSFWIWLLH